jgi:thymidylate synthase ThyX
MSEPRPKKQPTEVYAVYGVEPELQAYAMAKYSRSALSMKQSLKEISEHKAEQFLNTFYFQYGHRSIADLAHLAFAVERLSLLAAIAVVDEQRWDGQERSTRYQDFARPDYYVPGFGDAAAEKLYAESIDLLFAEYRAVSAAMLEQLTAQVPRPAAMPAEQYTRTLRARAFDIARYLLPLATNTSLGQIVNARTLEAQIARLLTSPLAEVRELGHKLKHAASSPAYSPAGASDVRVAPTLVKYADANQYLSASRQELSAAAAELMNDAEIAPAHPVDLLDDEPVEIELATTLLYEHCWYPYRQVRERVAALSAHQRDEIVAVGVAQRGKHDELLRAYCGGYRFRFDILMDIGGFRDLHRHRRCIQIGQDFTAAHGFDTPDDLTGEWRDRYAQAMQRIPEAIGELTAALFKAHIDDQAGAIYLLPLGYRKRTLFKMDFAEAVYITELRTAPAGHFSYRRIAWQMYQAVAHRYPALARHFRVHDPSAPLDLLQR